MKLNEKIRFIRKSILKISLKEFHKKLEAIFGNDAVTYHSLCRLEKGYRDTIRLRTLYQICTGLDVPLKELLSGTEHEESKIATIIRRKDRGNNKYIYNEKAVAETLNPRHMRFLAVELELKPLGATKEEQDPLDQNKFEKLVIVLQGEIDAIIGNEKHLLKKGDTLAFPSNLLHYFSNPSTKSKARCIIVQNPKSY